MRQKVADGHRVFVLVAVSALSVLFANCAGAAYPGVIYPGHRQGNPITDWGYDIKQPGKAEDLTPSKATYFFVTDKMSVLRVPIYPAVYPANINDYGVIKQAMKNARDAWPGVLFFASIKVGQDEPLAQWQDWIVDDQGRTIPSAYAQFLANFLAWMKESNHQGQGDESFDIDILGIDNENHATLTQYGGNLRTQQFKETVDALKAYPADFTMPLIIGPDSWAPYDTWMQDMNNNGWGGRVDLVGTHYYPRDRGNSLDNLANLFNYAGGRAKWNTEAHWDTDLNGDGVDESWGEQAQAALAVIFDCFDHGASGVTWWNYTRADGEGDPPKGILMRNLVQSTAYTQPIEVDDVDGEEITYGELITRAFRGANSVSLWAINYSAQDRDNHQFNLQSGYTIQGPVSYTRWKYNGEETGSATLVGNTGFQVRLAPWSVTMITFNLTPWTMTFKSVAADDGYVLESVQGSGVGGSAFAAYSDVAALRLGDNQENKQFRTVLSFDTSALPDGAGIVAATLRLKRGDLAGSDPFDWAGPLKVHTRKNCFLDNAALQIGDFEAWAHRHNVATMSHPTSNGQWSEGTLSAEALEDVNVTGKTQIRLEFSTATNGNATSDRMGFYSGNSSTSGNRPELVVSYVP